VAVGQGIIVLLLSLLVGFKNFQAHLCWLWLLFYASDCFAFCGLGNRHLLSVLEDMHGFQLIMNFLVMPIFFFFQAHYSALPVCRK